jgi:hypothetical protein
VEKIKTEEVKKWRIKSFWTAISNFFKNRFYREEGGKKKLIIESAGITFALISGPLLVLYFILTPANSAYIGKSSKVLSNGSQAQQTASGKPNYEMPVQQGPVVSGKSAAQTSQRSVQEIKFAAKQILVREDSNVGYGFSPGSNLIGELQSTIDTRDAAQTVRVVLPYGGRSKDGSSELPKGTLLLGNVQYPGKGEKVFILFQQAILPEGKTVKLTAIALDPKDYSTGLTGDIQSQAKSRALAAMGLSIASTMGSVLTEKEALGQYQVEAKSNMKNALLSGAGKAAEVEASRLQGQQGEIEDYLQVDAGTAVVISLTSGLSL